MEIGCWFFLWIYWIKTGFSGFGYWISWLFITLVWKRTKKRSWLILDFNFWFFGYLDKKILWFLRTIGFSRFGFSRIWTDWYWFAINQLLYQKYMHTAPGTTAFLLIFPFMVITVTAQPPIENLRKKAIVTVRKGKTNDGFGPSKNSFSQKWSRPVINSGYL